MDNINESYGQFKDKQEKLGALIREGSDCLRELSMTKYHEILNQLSKKVSDDSFKIMVVGTFKNGKSTFINSLLGKEILPAYAVPCTAVINEIKWGNESAVLYFRNPLPEKLPSELPATVENHIKRNGKKELPPITIPYKEIEDYVCIPMNKDFKEIALESPYEKLELFWPSSLLENGVEIIDSPGLNEHETREKVTNEYLSKADAILFVLNAQAICALEEMRFIENSLNNYGFTNPFFVVNRFDAIRKASEKTKLKEFAHSKLDQYTKQKIYFISAIDALEGKEDNNEAMLAESGVPELEHDLAYYLINERGKAKLKQPVKALTHILQSEALNKYIPDQRKLLEVDLNEIKKRLDNEKPKLDILRDKKRQLDRSFSSKISSASKQLAFLIRENTRSLENKVYAWTSECNIDDIGAMSNEAERKKAAERILEHVSQRIEAEQQYWNNEVLRPEIEKCVEDIFESAESRISEIYNVIDSINIGLTGGNPNTEAVPTWERIAGAVGGLMFGDISTAVSGGINGLSKEFFKTFAMNFGLAIGLGMLGILNPITAIPAMIGLIAYNFITGGNKVREQIKKGVSEEITKQLSQQSNEVADNMQKQFEAKFLSQAKQIVDALDIEINSVEQKVNDIIAEKEKGEEAIAGKKALLDRCENKINKILLSMQEFNDFVA